MFSGPLVYESPLITEIKKLINNSRGKEEGNHCRVGGFTCDKKSCSFT